MKARPICAACLLLRRAIELEQLGERKASAVISWFRSVLETATLYFGPDIEVTHLASMTFKRLRSITKVGDPYEHVKRQELEAAMNASEKLREAINAERDHMAKLKLALEVASYLTLVQRGLNNFFFGAAGPLSVIKDVETLVNVLPMQEGVVNIDELADYLQAVSSPTIYYLTGSVAELPFDEIVMDLLKEIYGAYVVAVVRSEPYEDYVTSREAEEAGLQDHADEVVEVEGSLTVTIEESSGLYASLSSSDLVVVKGELQSLYFVNNPPGPAMLLLVTTRCPLAAKVLGIQPGKVNAVFVPKRRRGGQPG